MSIIETKFRKNYVETPELKTNALVCNKFNYTGELSEESLGLPIFDITDKDEGTWYPVLKKLAINDTPAGNGAFRNVQLSTGENSAFHVLNNAKIKTITQVQRDDSRGDVSIDTECFMVLYGKKADNTCSFIAKSVNKNVQRHRGGTLTWNFSDVEWNYKNQYTKLIITLAQVPYAYDQDGSFTLDENMNRIELDFFEAYGKNGPTFPTVAYIPIVNSDGTKTYENMKMSCKGSNGGQCVVMSTNNTNTQNFTPQITISYTDLELQPATIPHKDNSQVHLTPSEKSKLMATTTQLHNHINDSQIHVTAQQKSRWDKVGDIVQLTAGEFIEINDNKISVKTSSSISNNTNTVPTSAALYAHANNNDLHINEDILSKIDKNASDIDSIATTLGVSTNQFNTLREGLVVASGGKMKVTGFQLSKKHFVTGNIQSIQIPYISGWDFTSSSPNPEYVNTNKEAYLAVQFFNEEQDENTIKTLNQTYFSLNTQTQPKYHSDTMTFEFENLKLPRDYKFVRIMCVDNKNETPNCKQGTNCLPFRVQVLSLESNNGDYTSFDDDDCKTFDTTGNYMVFVKAKTVSSALDVLENFQDTNNYIDEHISNEELHVNQTLTSKVDKIDQMQSSVKSIKQKINDIYTILNVRKESFTTMKDGLSSPDNQKMNAGMVVLSKAHFTSGIVKSISFPYAGGKGATVYLAVQVINENENISTVKTYQQTIYSSKPVTQEVNSNGTSTFEFSRLIIPENYKAVRFGFVENNTTVPQYNAENCLSGMASNAFRIKVLQNDSNNNNWDSDECQVYTAPAYGVGNYVTLIEATVLNSDLNQLFHKVQQIESELNQP